MTFKLLDLSLSLSLSHTHAHIKDQKWWAQIYYMMIPILLFMMQSTCTNFRLPKADISIAYKTCNPDTAHWWSNLYTDVTDLVFNSKADTVWTDMQIKVKKKKKKHLQHLHIQLNVSNWQAAMPYGGFVTVKAIWSTLKTIPQNIQIHVY